MPAEFRLLLIHHEKPVVQKDINNTLAEQIVPGLRKLIKTEAVKMTQRYGMDDSPFAVDAASAELLEALMGLLMLSEIDSPQDCISFHQLKKRFCKWWVGEED